MPKSIYLDSSDFSDLSSPQDRLRTEDQSVLTALRQARSEGTALFLLSPPLLSEAIHATEANKKDSVRRAALMRELCGTNTLRYPTEISKLELTRALSGESNVRLTLNDILSSDNEWFGFPYSLTSLKETRLNAQREIDIHFKALPREQRRKLKSQLNLSKRSSRQLWRQLIKESRSKSPPMEFPLNLMDQELFLEWFLGEKTDSDLQTHLKGILCDPYVLFRHVVDETGHRDTLYMMVRNGAGNLSAKLEELGHSLLRLSVIAGEIGQHIDANDFAPQLIPSSVVRNLASTLAEQSIEHLSDEEVIDLVKQCPSVATLVHALRAYLYTLVQSNLMRFRAGSHIPTIPKRSDFGDLTHSFYAPYVDVFRCDARFGALLKSYKPIRDRIAARRRDILNML